ncbi:lasso peptide biosynthesis B2 protein [Streptomyces sp. NPDC001508]|uniref:lasso peptide biosynthesis B2 protein n=1 Tax=Streptomyces sp. NPDC001508 TaxID=3154656 RepID=UPI00332C75BD
MLGVALVELGDGEVDRGAPLPTLPRPWARRSSRFPIPACRGELSNSRPSEPTSIPIRWRVAAVPVVLATAATWTVGPRRNRFSRLVRLACAGRDLPPATTSQARYAVRAVRWAARLLPMRRACLEDSAAAALLLTVARHRAEWCHGVALDPVRLHAWIADPEGEPVEEPADTALYTPTYTPDGPGLARADRGVRP